ncbi:hypothetical protein ACFYOR_36180 [Streptomyces griseofuscus]|uniref:hypothetical protein n=1 Tax=Streptomyces griseofuscus TaxID=146922 RepID=UPI0036914AC0
MAAAAELLMDYGVAGTDISFEQGEFDAVMEHGGVPVLAMEAKARIEGADGLLALLNSLLRPDTNARTGANSNHRRKYAALLDMAVRGPVTLWLVADGARWAFHASVTAGTLQLTPCTAAGALHVNPTSPSPRTSRTAI